MASGEGSTTADHDKHQLLLYIHNYSFYSQKVLLALEEKGVRYETRFVNIAAGEQYTPGFLQYNPKGEVPVLREGEKVIPDSARIIAHLEERSLREEWPGLTPLSEGAAVIERHNHFHTLLHDLPADVITIGSFYHQQLVRRPKMPFLLPVRVHMKNITERFPPKLRKLAEELPEYAEALKKKAEKLEADLAVMKDLAEYQKVLDTVDEVMKEVEEQLATNNKDVNRWLVSEKFTLADIDLTILLERLNQLGLEQRFWGSRPHIRDYYAKVRQRESYKKSMPTALFHFKTFLKSITYLQLF